jgi:hypothetical protein
MSLIFLVFLWRKVFQFQSMFKLTGDIIEQRLRKPFGVMRILVIVNLQAVAAGSLINLATVLYLNSIRVSCSHPASLFFPCGD